ncbi:MAG TPA: hypothetical protein VIJ09_09460, partial [Acidimicrobiales bacterium]
HEGVEIRTVESLIWRARQALKREYASIASVNSVIGGVALGRWGALRRAGGSVARRVHPVAGVLSSTGGARGLATAMALTSFAVVAAVLPGSSQAEHHAVAAVAPAAQANTGPLGSRGPGDNNTVPLSGGSSASPLAGGSALPSAPSASAGATDQTTVPPSATASGSSASGTVASGTAAIGVPGVSGALPNPGLTPVPPNPFPTNTLIPVPGPTALPAAPTGPAVAPIPPLGDLNQPIDPALTVPSLPSGSSSLTTPVEGLLGVK